MNGFMKLGLSYWNILSPRSFRKNIILRLHHGVLTQVMRYLFSLWFKSAVNIHKIVKKLCNKLTRSFSHVSDGMKFVTIWRVREAWHCPKEIKFDEFFLWTLPNPSVSIDFHEYYVKMFNVVLSILNIIVECKHPQQYLNPDFDKLIIENKR